MAFPVNGVPSHSGTNIPVIFSGKLLVKFYGASILTHISNTDYEGEIKDKGDTVKIRLTPDITINDYEKGTPLVYENPNSATVDLLIDQGKYYGVNIFDVDKAQSDYEFMDKWAEDASEQMKIVIDTDVLSAIPADAHASNIGATAGAQCGNINLGTAGAPVELTKANVLDKIVECGQILSEQKAPATGRWMGIPPWMKTRALLSDLKDASLTGDGQSSLRSGRLGVIGDFTLYESLNIKHVVDGTDNCASIPFGHKSGLTFASQLVKNETLKNPTDFGDILRGLQVYGFEVIKPEVMGVLYATGK
ncbi:hypothetical protein [Maridesulfovibrio sp.]|uniref:phage major capsid protein n=1 Tax=Maridesulfovibrio sp. TaxID=2795000 RepID=UPI0029CA3B7C|nr:hypothetical protein [Maridesulfovibrio sp.]